MDRTERFYRMQQLLHSQRAVTMRQFLDDLEVSRATVKRDLEYLRDRLNAPITWDRELRGYRLEGDGDDRYNLPGLWFSAAEAQALLTMEALLEDLQPGLLQAHLAPIRERIRLLLSSHEHSAAQVTRRIRILGMAARSYEPRHFEVVAGALLTRRRLRISHYNRQRDSHGERDVSPQRLVHYRGNWYLDAWCHLRKALRSFAVDAIDAATVLDQDAREIDDATLDAWYADSYGIFSGPATNRALLRFTPQAARWTAREQWHPRQRGWFDDEGNYLLEIPYGNDTELIMDILRAGNSVEVLEPAGLRQRVRERLQSALSRYD